MEKKNCDKKIIDKNLKSELLDISVISSLKLKENLLNFFKKQSNLDVFFNVIEKKSNYSLRVMEWFITNYCKEHVCSLNGVKCNIYKIYKNTLSSYTKEYFDPFKRTKNGVEKFYIYNPKTNSKIETTVCQLNFFKWIITNNIHCYLEKNLINVKNAMKDSTLKKSTVDNTTKNKNNNKKYILKNNGKITKKF